MPPLDFLCMEPYILTVDKNLFPINGVPYLPQVFRQRGLSKQCGHRSDIAEDSI